MHSNILMNTHGRRCSCMLWTRLGCSCSRTSCPTLRATSTATCLLPFPALFHRLHSALMPSTDGCWYVLFQYVLECSLYSCANKSSGRVFESPRAGSRCLPRGACIVSRGCIPDRRMRFPKCIIATPHLWDYAHSSPPAAAHMLLLMVMHG